jgi:hypothetical protein
MLKKINATYNRKNISNRGAANSIESYIREEMIRSSEDNIAGNGDAEETANKPTEDDKPAEAAKTDEKKKGFFKKVWEAIKKFFKSVYNYIKNFCIWIKNKISSLFRSKKPEEKKCSILDTSSPKELAQIIEEHQSDKKETSAVKTTSKEKPNENSNKSDTNIDDQVNSHNNEFNKMLNSKKPDINEERKEIIYNKIMKFNEKCVPICDKINKLCLEKEFFGYFPIIGDAKFVHSEKPTNNNVETLIKHGKQIMEVARTIYRNGGVISKENESSFKEYDDIIRKISKEKNSVINCGLKCNFIPTDKMLMHLREVTSGSKSFGMLMAGAFEKTIFDWFKSSDEVMKIKYEILGFSQELSNFSVEYKILCENLDKFFAKIYEKERVELSDATTTKSRKAEINNSSWVRTKIATQFRNGVSYINFITSYFSNVTQLYSIVYDFLC